MVRLSVVLALLALAVPASASATFPGPDGRIVFEGDPDHGSASLFTVSGLGGSVNPFIAASTAQTDPAYSADGRWVAFAEARDIWIARSDGKGKPIHVTKEAANDSEPVFSPDGKRVVYLDLNGPEPELFSVAIDGSDRKQLTSGGGSERTPTWVRG